MKYNNFEELPIWKQARELVKVIYQFKSNEKYKNDFSLQDQLQRCAVSVMNNIAEGFDSSSNKEFIRFLIYSQRSASEIMSMCYVLEDVYQLQEISKLVYNKCLELRKQIKGFVKYLRKS